MSDFLLHLLKANLALILFFVAYRLVLRRLTFYTLNRFFFLFALIFSALYPFVDLSEFLSKPEGFGVQVIHAVKVVSMGADLQNAQVFKTSAAHYNYWQTADKIFLIGMGLMTFRLILQLLSLYAIHRQSVTSQINGFQFRKMGTTVNPFSFWRLVYMNPDLYEKQDLIAILKHEQVHVYQWHTIDVLIAELTTLYCWFNPVVWLMKQSLKENLEFITDQNLLDSGTNKKSYQYSLIRISNLLPHSPLVNNFNFLTIKRRIAMMNQQRSSTGQVSRYVILIPLLVVAPFLFTVSAVKAETNNAVAYLKKIIPVVQEKIEIKTSNTAEIKTVEKTVETAAGLVSLKAEDVQSNATIQDSVRIAVDSMLVYVDLKLSNKKILNGLNSQDFKNVEFLSKEESVKRFGAKGEHGAIAIVTKSGTAGLLSAKTVNKATEAPLVLIDGKESTWDQLSNLSESDIQAFLMSNDIPKQMRYEEKGKGGVWVVVTKQGALAKKMNKN